MIRLSRSRILWLVGVSSLTVAAIRISILWYQRVSAFVHGLRMGATVILPDFTMMYTAGKLVEQGRWNEVYDVTSFAHAYTHVAGYQAQVGSAVFPYPPPTGLVLSIVSRLNLASATILWTLLSLAAVSVGTRLITRSWWPLPLVLLSMPALLAIRLGQNTAFSLLVLAVGLLLIRKDHPLAAGAILGLLILKPQLALGLVLWWVVSPKRLSREALGAAISAGGILVMSLIIAPDGWRTYLSSLSDLVNPPGIIPAGSFSLMDFTRFLIGSGTTANVITFTGTVFLLVVFAIMLRRFRASPRLGFGVALLASVLLSPHMVSYDWLLLLVPGAILWEHFRPLRPELISSAGVLSLSAVYSAEIVVGSLRVDGWAFSPAFPLLLMAATWLLIGAQGRATTSLGSPVLDV